ncbi:MAG: type I methionyl aminopeptidase [Nitrospinota bacterium]|nr:type I methionyl aminopeptidase [Nitrospinota bacterium]
MIILKSRQEIEKIRYSCQIVAETLKEVRDAVRSGVTTIELDEIAEKGITKRGAIPAFKGYRGFPGSLCTSVNESVVHGVPSNLRLKEGDIVSFDLGSLYDGYFGDAAITMGVGQISEEATRLLKTTEEALYIAIEKGKAGNHLYDISKSIQDFSERKGYSVVRDFVGHGIGSNLHEEPQIPNFVPENDSRGPLLKEGMVLALEPMINVGTHEVRVLNDQWTVVTADRKLAAHFEHTIAITRNEADILSKFN